MIESASQQNPEQKITYHLEMNSRDELIPAARESVAFDVRRVERPFPELNWLMHQVVGADYRWAGREAWGKSEWTAYVDRPELQTWIAYVSGTPAGYFEIEKHEDCSVQIECFGLRKEFFGQGIVKTTEDFGVQGSPPTNQALLDWLAVKFVSSGYDLKALQKLIVTSATYRQTSALTDELAARDLPCRPGARESNAANDRASPLCPRSARGQF